VVSWGASLTLIWLYRWDVAMAKSRLTRPVCFAGIMCYSLYLVHLPLTKAVSHLLNMAGIWGIWPTLLVTVPVCVGVSVALGWLFHVRVERRFLNTPAVMPHRLIEAAEKAALTRMSEARQPQPGPLAAAA
jgi:peptidoglycan/LPS O-acetylase OafA/YrhL